MQTGIGPGRSRVRSNFRGPPPPVILSGAKGLSSLARRPRIRRARLAVDERSLGVPREDRAGQAVTCPPPENPARPIPPAPRAHDGAAPNFSRSVGGSGIERIVPPSSVQQTLVDRPSVTRRPPW